MGVRFNSAEIIPVAGTGHYATGFSTPIFNRQNVQIRHEAAAWIRLLFLHPIPLDDPRRGLDLASRGVNLLI
jgi:hypothetical protein